MVTKLLIFLENRGIFGGNYQNLIKKYFSETTLNHFKPQQGLTERYQRRAIDVTLAAKLTLTYGKYHLAMLHRQLAMSEEQTTYQQGRINYAMFCLEYLELNS